MRIILGLISIFFIVNSFANTNLVKVEAIGNSPKGKYFAIEEYGYHTETQKPFSRIRLVNVFQNKYVGLEIEVNADNKNQKLNNIRKLARKKASKQAKRFKVNFQDS